MCLESDRLRSGSFTKLKTWKEYVCGHCRSKRSYVVVISWTVRYLDEVKRWHGKHLGLIAVVTWPVYCPLTDEESDEVCYHVRFSTSAKRLLLYLHVIRHFGLLCIHRAERGTLFWLCHVNVLFHELVDSPVHAGGRHVGGYNAELQAYSAWIFNLHHDNSTL